MTKIIKLWKRQIFVMEMVLVRMMLIQIILMIVIQNYVYVTKGYVGVYCQYKCNLKNNQNIVIVMELNNAITITIHVV